MKVQIVCDGGCTPWRKGTVGFVVRDLTSGEIVFMGHRNLVGRCTNNIAEYSAVIHSCEYAIQHEHTYVRIVTDSQLVFRQISGEYVVRKKELKVLHRKVIKLLKQIKATLKWHRRDEGDGPLADALASHKWREVINGNRSDIRPTRNGKNVDRLADASGLAALDEFRKSNRVENAEIFSRSSQS